MKRIFNYLLLFLSLPVFSQVKLGTFQNPSRSAAVDFNLPANTYKGILIPRFSTDQLGNIPLAQEGLLLYNTTRNKFSFYKNQVWIDLLDPSLASNNDISIFPRQLDLTQDANEDFLNLVNTTTNANDDISGLELISNQVDQGGSNSIYIGSNNYFGIGNTPESHGGRLGGFLQYSSVINQNQEVTNQYLGIRLRAEPNPTIGLREGDYQPITLKSDLSGNGYVGFWHNDPQANFHIKTRSYNGVTAAITMLYPGSGGPDRFLVSDAIGNASWKSLDYVRTDFGNLASIIFQRPSEQTSTSFQFYKFNLVSATGLSGNGINQTSNNLSFTGTLYEVQISGTTTSPAGNTVPNWFGAIQISLVPDSWTNSTNAGGSDRVGGQAISQTILIRNSADGSNFYTNFENFYPQANTNYKIVVTVPSGVGNMTLENLVVKLIKVY